jgi:hypothetical protein
VIHRARTAAGLSGRYRQSCAIVPRRRALTGAVVARSPARAVIEGAFAWAELVARQPERTTSSTRCAWSRAAKRSASPSTTGA